MTDTRPADDTWATLNVWLRTANEASCEAILAEELAGRARQTHLARLHGRLNKLRGRRERQTLLQQGLVRP